jgi:hypothetical protein
MVAKLGKSGQVTDAEAKAIADYVNVATGRGHIGLSENAAVGLNTVFFAPRLVASRFNLLLGQPMVSAAIRARSPRAVKMIAGEYAKFMIGIGVVYSLAKLMGAEIEEDPRSSDFGKIRIGNTRIDPMTGLAQTITLLSRLVSGTTISANKETLPLRENYRMPTPGYTKVPYGRNDVDSVGMRFMRTKFSPVFGAAWTSIAGKDVIGRVVGKDISAAKVWANVVIPMSGRDIYEAIKEQGFPAGVAMSLVGLFGAGLSTYSKKDDKPTRPTRPSKDTRGGPQGPRGPQRP